MGKTLRGTWPAGIENEKMLAFVLHDICSLARLGFVQSDIASRNILYAKAVTPSLLPLDEGVDDSLSHPRLSLNDFGGVSPAGASVPFLGCIETQPEHINKELKEGPKYRFKTVQHKPQDDIESFFILREQLLRGKADGDFIRGSFDHLNAEALNAHRDSIRSTLLNVFGPLFLQQAPDSLTIFSTRSNSSSSCIPDTLSLYPLPYLKSDLVVLSALTRTVPKGWTNKAFPLRHPKQARIMFTLLRPAMTRQFDSFQDLLKNLSVLQTTTSSSSGAPSLSLPVTTTLPEPVSICTTSFVASSLLLLNRSKIRLSPTFPRLYLQPTTSEAVFRELNQLLSQEKGSSTWWQMLDSNIHAVMGGLNDLNLSQPVPSSPEQAEQFSSGPCLLADLSLLEEVLSLPVKTDIVAKQEKVLSFLREQLNTRVNIPNLPYLLSLSEALQKTAEELSGATQDDAEVNTLTGLSTEAAAFCQAVRIWLKRHPQPSLAPNKGEAKMQGEKAQEREEEETRTLFSRQLRAMVNVCVLITLCLQIAGSILIFLSFSLSLFFSFLFFSPRLPQVC